MTSRKRADQEPRDTFLVFHLCERVLCVSFNNRLTFVISTFFILIPRTRRLWVLKRFSKTLRQKPVVRIDANNGLLWLEMKDEIKVSTSELTTKSSSSTLSIEGMSTTRCAHPLLDVHRFSLPRNENSWLREAAAIVLLHLSYRPPRFKTRVWSVTLIYLSILSINA